MARPKSPIPPKRPEITQDVRILWHGGYYDGILDAVCLYKGEPHHATFKKEYYGRKTRDTIFRTFWLVKVSPEQWRWIQYWHSEFEAHVGGHSNYVWSDRFKRYIKDHSDSSVEGSYEHWIEMYYDRYNEWRKDQDNASKVEVDLKQTVGWCTYDTLLGRIKDVNDEKSNP